MHRLKLTVYIMQDYLKEDKITYSADNPESVLSSLRNDYNPRIAVNVDMIATGTDVKPRSYR